MNKTPKLRFKEFSDNYKKTQFSDCVSIRNGQVDPCIEPYCDMPHIGPGNMEKFTGRLLEVRTAKKDGQMSGKYLFDKDDILYGKINPQLGKVVFPKYEGLCSADTYPLKASKEMISNYLFYSLQTSRFLKYSISVSMRTGMPKINREDLNLYNFNLPSIKEQEKISYLFSIIDKKISLQDDKVNILKDYKKGMIKKIFIRELRFKDDDGRDYPEWEDKKLLNYTEKITTKNRAFTITNVISNSAKNGLISQRDFFDKDIANQSNIDGYYVIEPGNFVYNPRKSIESPYGPINRYELQDAGVVSPLYLCFRVNNEEINGRFLAYYFKSSVWHRFIYQNSDQGVRHDRVSIKDAEFFNMDIGVPDIDEQNKIVKFLDSLECKLSKEQDKLDYLTEYKKGLLQQMFI